VLDFGLAKHIRTAAPAEVTRNIRRTNPNGRRNGHAALYVPEQISGRPLDHRSDIFSLGIILHEMTTEAARSKARLRRELAAAILRDHPRP